MADVEIKYLRNPAGRLYLILQKLSNYESCQADHAWKEILQLPADAKSHLLLYKLSKVMFLPNEIIYWVDKLKLDREQFVNTWYTPFNAATNIFAIQGNTSEFNNLIDKTCLTSLGFVSHEFNNRNIEPEINTEQLTELEKELLHLIETVRNSKSLDPALHEYLLRNLDMLLRAVEDYSICGNTPLQNTSKTVIGSILTDNIARQSKDDGLCKKLWSITCTILNISSVCEKGYKLLEYKDEIPNLFVE